MLTTLLRSRWAVPCLLGFFCFVAYNANLRQIGAGDTVPARYLPLLIWKHRTVALEDHVHLVANGHPRQPNRDRPAGAEGKLAYCESSTYWLVATADHRLASLYPVVTPLLVAPLYLPSVLWLNSHGWEQPNLDRVAELMEKLSASLVASLATVVMYLVLRRDCGGWSVPLALAFGLGTNTWMIASQGLWQHGTGELLVALALLLAIGDTSRLRMGLLGMVCVLMAANRPPDALIAAAFIAWTIWTQRSKAIWLAAGAALPMAALLAYNLNFIGFLAGGYAAGKNPHRPFFHINASGVLGLLVSPTRGLLVFSPFYVFVFSGLLQRVRTPVTKILAMALGLAAAAQVLVYSQADWRAGFSWGPRWLTDLLPILTWLLAPAVVSLRALSKIVLITAIAAAIAIQAIGAFWYTRLSDEQIFAAAQDPMSGAWKLSNTPFVVEFQQKHSEGDLLRHASGEVERIDGTLIAGSKQPPVLKAGATLVGWAQAGNRAPSQVFLLIDGIIVGASQDFLPRAGYDNQQTAGTWRITANTQGVSPGVRILQTAVRIEPRGNLRIVREQQVCVAMQEMPLDPLRTSAQPFAASELAQFASRAASRLRDHQSSEGYWLTAHTKRPRYDAPKQEMNTFLTATLIDFLAPIASRHGINDLVERARAHLSGQIEENGLVRYHGRPDGPAIGKLCYPITPDSDDTALAWRISGRSPHDPEFRAMLKTLKTYRDARGLYRTWLAPQAEYVNLNPGFDPNPTDLGIQVNVCLMLHDLAPSAARDLSKALQRFRDDGDLWVYYSKAPLLPYLRIAQLRQRGYEIALPSERLALPAPGQEIWSQVAQEIVQRELGARNSDAAAITSLLEQLSRDDFARIRTSPPLLYHNDQSATVERYYWSEDFGYALWLHLYDQSMPDRQEHPRTIAQ